VVTKIINEYAGKIQYHAGYILRRLEKSTPEDCYCFMMMSDYLKEKK
jgi:hypothetical protein